MFAVGYAGEDAAAGGSLAAGALARLQTRVIEEMIEVLEDSMGD
jgi:hypothetical protein